VALVVAFAVVAVLVTGMQIAFQLPRPTGPLPVGTVALQLPREAVAGEPAGSFRLRVWYPGRPSTARTPYGIATGDLRHLLYHLIVRTNAAPDVAVASSIRPFPVVIYAAGWGNDATDNTALAEDLASHGLVVAAMGDVNHDSPALQTLGGPPDFTSERAYHGTVLLGDEKLRYQARRASSVLDYLGTLNAHDPEGRFTGRLGVARAGLLGFSFGGAIALKTCREDRRFKAVMNMDGWIFDASSGYRGGVTYFLVSSGSPSPGLSDVTAADPVRRYTSQFTVADEAHQLEVLRHGGYALNVGGADHLNFTDVPLYAPLHRLGGRRHDAGRMARVVRAYAVAFFEQELAGKPSPLLAATNSPSPSVTLERYPLRAAAPDEWKSHDATY
jgi:dienelactone hydrolase